VRGIRPEHGRIISTPERRVAPLIMTVTVW
jgi:hypothetical protein